MKYQNFNDYVDSFSQRGDRLALTTRSFLKIERLTYKELQQRAYQAAHYLSDLGIGLGDRVMVVATNSPQWIELLLGSQLIGAILVTVDVSSSSQTIVHHAKETKPKVIFKNSSGHSESLGLDNIYSLDELSENIAKYSTRSPKNKLEGKYPALIVFTSGTTADPKGVVLTQANVLANVEGVQQRISINPNWRALSVLPLSHMYELTGSLALLSGGCSIFYIPRVTPAGIAKALQTYQITTILAIPQLLIILRQRIEQAASEAGKTKLLNIASSVAKLLPFQLRRYLFWSVHSKLGGHLELVVTGGAPIPIDVAKAWENMGVRMVQGYGLTETSPILTANGLNNRRLDSPGRPLANLQLRIADDGEIQAKGPSIFGSYWHNSSATKAAFSGDGWFKTGDIGRLVSGWLHIQGRIKFMIVLSSGLKVFPEDIEVVAEKNSVFKDFCVVGLHHPSGEIVLAVVLSDNPEPAIDQAISQINSRLESFQHISSWRRWPDSDFPRTRLLKVDRKQVELWANSNSDSKPKNDQTSDNREDHLLKILQQSLGFAKTNIKESDQLADIGLDSLRRLNVVSLIEVQLGITIPEEKVTQTTTVANLRKLLAKGSQTAATQARTKWTYRKSVRLLGNAVREIIIRAVVRIWVKMKIEGRDNLTTLSGPAIFIFNHSDDFDGPVIYNCLPHAIRKRLAVAAADDVMRDHKILAFIIRFCFAGFNFAREEPYIPSLEYLSELIDKDWNVLISPEGRINNSGTLQPFKSGIGLLAVNLGVAIVPIKTIGLTGTVPLHAKWPKKRSHITVRIGKPQYFNTTANYDDVTRKLHKIMEEL